MNPIHFQESVRLVEPHSHRCGCGCTWSHDKSKIPAGAEFASHRCPRCGVEISFRVDLGGQVAEFPEFYGSAAARSSVNPVVSDGIQAS